MLKSEHDRRMSSNANDYGMPREIRLKKWKGCCSVIDTDEPSILSIPYGQVRSPKNYVLLVNDNLEWVDRGFFEHQDWRNSSRRNISKDDFIGLLDAQIERESLFISDNLPGAVVSRRDYAMRNYRDLLSKTEPGESWVKIMEMPLTGSAPGTGTYVIQEVLGRYGEFGEDHRFSISSVSPQLFWASGGKPRSELEVSELVTKRLSKLYKAFEVPKTYLDQYGFFNDSHDEKKLRLD
jgi:hypothetical protein